MCKPRIYRIEIDVTLNEQAWEAAETIKIKLLAYNKGYLKLGTEIWKVLQALEIRAEEIGVSEEYKLLMQPN